MNGFFRNAAVGLLAWTVLTAVPVQAQQSDTAPAAQLDRLQRADGALVVPDRFLRRWDPVTVFFGRDTGPSAGGPEDAPERLVTISPPVPGAWQWLNARALQFRPTEPWTPLQRITLTAGGRSTQLVPLLPAPVATAPAATSDPIPNLETIDLVFPDPVDTEALARLISIELRASSGALDVPAEVLTAQDFTVRAIERSERSERQTYQVVLRRPVPDGRALVLRLRLSDVQGMDDPTYELRLRGVTPFNVMGVNCSRGFLGEVQDGVMQCMQTSESGNERLAPRGLQIAFSETPEAIDIVRARDLLRISPPVDNLAVRADGRRLLVTGRFEADVPYELNIVANGLKDSRGRVLERGHTQRFAFLPSLPQLSWDTGQGIAERNGPQMVPMRGRGYDRVDLRIHQIDPLSREFWPFPSGGLTTDDDVSPPLPGNEPRVWAGGSAIRREAIAARIRAMGSPAVSELVTLPTQRGGADAKFGLNIAALLAKISGANQPGTYLLGMRPVDGGRRQWMRLQVTDLSLSTVEEADRVHFQVTSLSTARPVEGAQIRLEGVREDEFVTLAQGTTGADGGFTWTAPESARAGTPRGLLGDLQRIVVVKGNDILVLNTDGGPQQYTRENWSRPEESWLSWTQGNVSERDESPQTLCHIFTERPIYRPEEPVHIQGYVRSYRQGALSFARGDGTLVVQGPGGQEWTVPVTLDANGGFYHLFSETTEATGDYRVFYRPTRNTSCEMVATFKKEAYRLPTFEVVLNGPDRTALDRSFDVSLLARYFAGGVAANRPISWRVTQFPYNWNPPSREGFLFSTDARFSGMREFRSTPVLEREARTDNAGAARISLDPTIEPTAQPRRYVVEATVTGDDDLQVRSTQQVLALPPFVLGVKVERYLPQPGAIDPEILAVDSEGKPLAGVAMTARLIRRNWNSVLQASDFSQGAAHYITEVVEETVEERRITSTAEAQKLHFAVRDAGVYVVELEAEDQIGRRQTVRVDLFMAGDTQVTWPRAPSQTVTVTTTQQEYAPGETATLLIQSPFQSARALAIVEEPEGRFRYDWVDIVNGVGTYNVTIRREHMPRLPVHFLLMRGRLAMPAQAATAPFDQGKPVTLAATAWIRVKPVKHQVTVTIEAPANAQPGEEIEVTLKLTDDTGRALSGEVAFWMVDQAVLTLAREAPLDPLRNFIVQRDTHMVARDTRNMAFGVIPLEETPGGDGGEEDEFGLGNISVRRNFTPVPVYMPRVQVGSDGTARVRVRLPDTLTVYRFRAKAISGPDRFGVGVGEIRIRQPIVAQPTLPRFIRPGDTFSATMVARVIEGPVGGLRAAIEASGLEVTGASEQNIAVGEDRSTRVEFGVSVPEGESATTMVRLRMGVQRTADRAGDAVQIDLPVRPDRMPVHRRQVVTLDAGGGTQEIPPPDDEARAGTYNGRVSITGDAVLAQMVSGLNYILETPYGGVEQHIALGAAELALRPFTPLLQTAGIENRMAHDIPAAVNAIRQAVDEDGLVAFWPRMRGSVWLTAQAYRFLVAAERAEVPIDRALKDRLAQVLARALRSDYRRLLSGEEIRERVVALIALAEGGDVQQAYGTELVRRAAFMPTETLAQAVQVLTMMPEQGQPMTASALEALWSRVQMLDRGGRSVYRGLAETSGNPLILPSETRALSNVIRAVTRATPDDIRVPVLREALLRLGQNAGGWGNTNTNAAALLALAQGWVTPSVNAPVAVMMGNQEHEGTISPDKPLLSWTMDAPGAVRMRNGGVNALVALVEQNYVPAGLGATAEPILNGLVLNRASYRAHANAPLERLQPGTDGAVHLAVGDVVEEVAELVNPEDLTHVAIILPIAAGMEPLNASLATATADAAASTELTLTPDWVAYRDDSVMYVYTQLPKGNYRLAFRARALVPGSFTQPPGEAATMYRPDVYGTSAGQRVVIAR